METESARERCVSSRGVKVNLVHQQALQFPPTIVDAIPVGGIHHPDERVGFFKVVFPIRPERLLAADVP